MRMGKIDKVVSLHLSPVFTLGISIQCTSSSDTAIRQWRQVYISFLFWELSILKAWTEDKE